MPTTKKRINITVDDDTYTELEQLSSREKRPLSRIGLDLIEQALELREDRHFSEVADRRLEADEERFSHDDVWG